MVVDFDIYIEDENSEGSEPRIIQDYGSYRVSRSVERFYKLLEIEDMSVEEAADMEGFNEKAVEHVENYLEENSDEFNEQDYEGFEVGVSEDAMPVPDDPFEYQEFSSAPYQKARKILTKGQRVSSRQSSEKLSITDLKEDDDRLKANVKFENEGGSIEVFSVANGVRMETEVFDLDYEQKMFADTPEGVVDAMNLLFDDYIQFIND